ncbi:MAG: hypothetical protein RMJ43_16320 [Chloroherpetonaceae bacterium]|nr:hypothetical protein [Chthonomonadaceae bacterium]MDW8209399.1 hypothetical protein [Chloroherpetonaceae bacterium]
MGKLLATLVTALWLLRAVAPLGVQALAQTVQTIAAVSRDNTVAANRIAGYTAWDDDFLYLAFQVNKPTVRGTSTAPYSNPLADDSLVIAFQTDGDRTATGRTEKTLVIVVSGAGGAQVYLGAGARPLFASFEDIARQLEEIPRKEPDPNRQAQMRAELLGKLLKFQVTPRGAMRPTGTPAPGYTVEIAVPWVHLGGRPDPGRRMGFHVAARSTTPDSPPLQSLSAAVRTGEDLDNPSLWNVIEFRNAPAGPEGDTVFAARVLGARPNIDGELTEGEWPSPGGFEFGERAPTTRTGVSLAAVLAARARPEFTPRPPQPAVPFQPSTAPRPMPERQAQKFPALTLARYFFYQADLRLTDEASNVWKPDGASLLVQHPLGGAGPWFSAIHADYHRRFLTEARRAGIDALLPFYTPSPEHRRLNARSLTALSEALHTLRQSGQDYPQIGLFLDTTAFAGPDGQKPDLRQAEAQSALYHAIRDFFYAIPAPFRLTVPLSVANGGRRACVVFLSSASAFRDMDASFVAYLRGRFATDFDNQDLILIGETGFKGRAPLDGYFTEAGGYGMQLDASGLIRIACITPARALPAQNGASPPQAPRRAGDAYRAHWSAVLEKSPDWVVLESWNDYAQGRAIAPTLEAGYSLSDLTRVYTRLFAGLQKRGVKFLWHDVPTTLPVNSRSVLNIRVQNTGTEAWTNGIGFACRWVRDGQPVMTGEVTALPTPVPAGQNATVTLGVSTQGLAPGNYVLEIGAVQADRKGRALAWISRAEEASLLQIPVRVVTETDADAPVWAASVLRAQVPPTPERGGVYEVQADLRNEGTRTWRRSEEVRVALRLYRTQGTDIVPVPAADASARLETDVAPGQITTVRIQLPLVDPSGQPLPASEPETGQHYLLVWEVARGPEPVVQLTAQSETRAGTAEGTSFAPRTLLIVDLDFGARFTFDGTPSALPGMRRLPVRLGLQNLGPQTWKQGQVRIGYHWYYLDGAEFLWEDETTALPQDVPPGGTVNDLLAYVTPPPYDGTYYLVWDVKVGDLWASQTEATRTLDRSVREIRVIGGRLTFADLTRFYNLDGISDAEDPTDGDFDGTGRTLPADLVPPFADAPIAPATLWQATQASGPDSPRRISFRMGPKEPKANNFIACRGQRIDLGKSAAQCRTLHILAASTGQDLLTRIRLIFREPTRESEDLLAWRVHRWDAPAPAPEHQGIRVQRVHTRNGTQNGTFGLHHYTVSVREPRKLIAVQLPDAPDIKIAALTLEK